MTVRAWPETRRLRAFGALALLAALACEDSTAPRQPESGLGFGPAAMAMVVGDSVALVLGFSGAEAEARVLVTSSAPNVAEPSITDAPPTGHLYVRGRSPGTATLTVMLQGRQPITGTVPVTVRSRVGTP